MGKSKGNNINLMIVSIFLFLQTGYSQSSLSDLEWLLGSWTSKSGKSIITESWHKVSKNTFEGSGSTQSTSTGEVAGEEELRMVNMRGEVFYLAKVDHNEYPVAFKLTEINDSLAIFQNPAHDFPTQIQYQQTGKDQVTVSVSNDKRSFTIIFNKLKEGKLE